jgi:hypothetical protein
VQVGRRQNGELTRIVWTDAEATAQAVTEIATIAGNTRFIRRLFYVAKIMPFSNKNFGSPQYPAGFLSAA